MAKSNNLLRSPPHPVELTLKHLGANLRTARVRRKITIAAAADRIGTGPRAVMDAEKGKPSTAVAVYAALLWLYDLLEPFDDLANPAKDREGLTLELAKMPARVRKTKGLDREF
jgi:transcriptional regulator with XRE-family HTH domain